MNIKKLHILLILDNKTRYLELFPVVPLDVGLNERVHCTGVICGIARYANEDLNKFLPNNNCGLEQISVRRRIQVDNFGFRVKRLGFQVLQVTR